MADYLTAQQMCDLYGYGELAAIATPRDLPNVTGALLRATVEGSDVTQWSTEEQAAAIAAVVRLDAVIDEAEEYVNGTLRRAGYTVPLTAPDKLISSLTRKIARHDLHKDNPGEAVRTGYTDSRDLLKEIAAGRFALNQSIDGDSDSSSDNPGEYDIGKTPDDFDRTFTDEQLDRYSRRQ